MICFHCFSALEKDNFYDDKDGAGGKDPSHQSSASQEKNPEDDEDYRSAFLDEDSGEIYEGG